MYIRTSQLNNHNVAHLSSVFVFLLFDIGLTTQSRMQACSHLKEPRQLHLMLTLPRPLERDY